jgi:hypothetical protein
MMHARHRLGILSAVLAALVAIGCGDSDSSLSPTSPSGTGARGATIAGQVVGAVASSSASPMQVTTQANGSLTVAVVGTNITGTVDRDGRFVLNGVPPGTVPLQFNGSGVNATLMITGVREGDHIQIRIRINGNNVTLEFRQAMSEAQGGVRALGGSCPALSFTLNGTMVRTDASTSFDDISCSQIRNGTEVEVKGMRQPDGSLLAVRVEAEDDDEDDEDDDEFEVRGTVAGLTGTCPNLRFTVNGSTIVTNGGTKFDGGCSRIQNGRRVEVEGVRQSNGEVLAREVEIDD